LTTADRVGIGGATQTVGLQVAVSAVGSAAVPAVIGLVIGAVSARTLAPALLVLAGAMCAVYWLALRPVPTDAGAGHARARVGGAGLSGAEGGRRVAAQDLAAGSAGLGGAVGVQDDLPVPAVDAHVVVELAQQDAVGGAGLAAVFLVPDVVHVAPGGGPAAARPGAAPVPQQHGAPDVRRDARFLM
jgi:hypothetical protein